MKNKVLVKLFLPELDITYDVFVPVNELVWKIKILLIRSIEDILKISVNYMDFYLINKDNFKIYNSNDVIINTDIRNGSELMLISNKIISN